MSLYEALQPRILAGEVLDESTAEALMGNVMDGELDEVQMAALLSSLTMRGESIDEITGFARAMRARSEKISAPVGAVDTCGTGGSKLPTVNTSTLTAFVLAASGVPVAKHGNRASTGQCGSSDVLDRLGVHVDLPARASENLLRDLGLTFLFAPRFHPAMRVVGPVRKRLGFRTVFNFLGPLCNPAEVRRQLLGVSSRAHAPMLIEVLSRLGAERVLVACGQDGLDELSLAAPTDLWFLDRGEIRHELVVPEDFSLLTVPFEDIAGGMPQRNQDLFVALLDGDERAGARVDHLALNVGAGLWVAGRVDSLGEGVAAARDLVTSGRARATFESFRSASLEVV